MKKPNSYYYWIAKEFIKRAYSKTVSNSFFSYEITKKGNYTVVECFNGGAFISIKIADDHITRKGDYSKHRFVNKSQILKEAKELLENRLLPTYFSIKFQENITTNARCIPYSEIEKAKRDVIRSWNICHSTSQIKEPINWIIKEV